MSASLCTTYFLQAVLRQNTRETGGRLRFFQKIAFSNWFFSILLKSGIYRQKDASAALFAQEESQNCIFYHFLC
ncbi:hypothetical protein B6259_02165 [Ruminococcaceae bacterium CPB6]|nr:hypothetical protein B6259_02165 [Ruminococcaceae bacterium CPB6]